MVDDPTGVLYKCAKFHNFSTKWNIIRLNRWTTQNTARSEGTDWMRKFRSEYEVGGFL